MMKLSKKELRRQEVAAAIARRVEADKLAAKEKHREQRKARKEKLASAPEPQPDRINMMAVKERGWTGTLIRRFLGEPDAIQRNRRYPRAAPTKLYDLDRVKRIEATDEFQEAKAKAAIRQNRAKKAAEQRIALRDAEDSAAFKEHRELVQTLIDSVVFPPLPEYTYEELLERATRSYKYAVRDFGAHPSDSSPTTLARIMVNHVRHHITNYDVELDKIREERAFDRHQLYRGLKVRVLDAIAVAYPWLKDECERQKWSIR